MATVRIGCSGFSYNDWVGNFYPPELPIKERLKFYSTYFNTVEINTTFYRVPIPETFEKWYQTTPTDFCFSLKGNRYITHYKKLLGFEEPLVDFYDSTIRLFEKLSVILWQFPPGFTKNIDRLSLFIKILNIFPFKTAFEFRHESWLCDEVFNLCYEHNVSLCMADWPDFIDDLPVTADFVYIRRHGKSGSYNTCYNSSELENDARRIFKYLKENKDVYFYFNNDYLGYAPKNARELQNLLIRV